MNGAPWQTMAGSRRDRTITQKQLNKGTVKRILRFARPYRRWLIVFLALILFDAILAVVNPLILKKIIDEGVAPGAPRGNPGLVVGLAFVVAGIAVLDALLSLLSRWYSARSGEGL